MLPQKGMPVRPPMGVRPSSGLPSRTTSGFQLRTPPLGAKSAFSAVRKPTPPPKALGSIFDAEGKHGHISDKDIQIKFKKFARDNFSKVKLTQRQSEMMIKKALPYQITGGGMTSSKMKGFLKKIRNLEFQNKDKRTNPYKAQRKIFEAFTRIKNY